MKTVTLLDLVEAPGPLWEAAETVRVRLNDAATQILRLEADIAATKRVADALCVERDDLKTRLAAVTLELAAARKKRPKTPSPLVINRGWVNDIATLLELEPSVVCDLIENRPVQGVHPTIAERARTMWHDATDPNRPKDTQ